MDKIILLVLGSFLILIGVINSWTTNPTLSISIGSFYVVFLLGILFEIRGYHNKNVYLTISTLILILGLILSYIYAFKFNYMQDTNKFILAGLVVGGTFCMTLAKANSWKKTKMEMKI